MPLLPESSSDGRGIFLCPLTEQPLEALPNFRFHGGEVQPLNGRQLLSGPSEANVQIARQPRDG